MRKNAGGKRRKREPLTTFRTISYTEMSDSRLYPTKEKTLCTNHSVFLVGTNAAARSPAAYVSPTERTARIHRPPGSPGTTGSCRDLQCGPCRIRRTLQQLHSAPRFHGGKRVCAAATEHPDAFKERNRLRQSTHHSK